MDEVKTKNVKDLIIEKVLEGFGTDENPTIPWKKPWVSRFIQPYNPISGNYYNGMNNLFLYFIQSIIAENNNKEVDPRWCTFIQAKNKGYKIRKGEKATSIGFYKPGFKTKDKNNEDSYVNMVFKTFYVFNFSQIDDVPELEVKKFDWTYNEKFDEIINIFNIKISHKEEDKSFYRPLTDEICLPDRSQFENVDGYYSTLFHEIIHWTGHKTRLNRFKDSGVTSEPKYAYEELVAEIGCLFLKEKLGYDGIDNGLDNSINYIQHWKKLIIEEKKYFFSAIKDAEKAVKFITDKIDISNKGVENDDNSTQE